MTTTSRRTSRIPNCCLQSPGKAGCSHPGCTHPLSSSRDRGPAQCRARSLRLCLRQPRRPGNDCSLREGARARGSDCGNGTAAVRLPCGKERVSQKDGAEPQRTTRLRRCDRWKPDSATLRSAASRYAPCKGFCCDTFPAVRLRAGRVIRLETSQLEACATTGVGSQRPRARNRPLPTTPQASTSR